MMPLLLEIARLKKNMLIVVGILLLLNAGLYTGLNFYLEPAVNSVQLKWSDLRRKVAARGHMDVTALYHQGKADLDKLGARLPSKRQFPRVLGDILAAAASNNVTSSNLVYKPELVKDQNLVAYDLTMNVKGSYAGIKSFIADILMIREMVVIDSFMFSQTEATAGNITMNLHLTVFMREAA